MSEGREGFVPNPILAGLLGICPLIAVSKSLAEGVVYGLGAALCALTLGAIVPPSRAILADRLQNPAMLVLSSALALAYGFCVRFYSSAIAAGLWIYLPLLAVSGLSLSTIRRRSTYDRYGPDGRSRLVVIAIESLMFLLTAAFVGGLREIVGLGTLTLPTPGIAQTRIIVTDFAILRILVSPAGGFILLGFLVAAYRAMVRAGGRGQP
jgi:Na+-translocating ferredoxin:NAD+ oxidoreductase subunit E